MFRNIITQTKILDRGKLEACTNHQVRRLSDMSEMFKDQEKVESILKHGNPIIYEVYEVVNSSEEGDLSFATTHIKPGTIGEEYYMTKGHLHKKRSRAEVYLGIEGLGLILLEKDGETHHREIHPKTVVYVPPGWAHRAVNVSSNNLVFLAVYPSDSGHDYEPVARSGFGVRVLRDPVAGYRLVAARAGRQTAQPSG